MVVLMIDPKTFSHRRLAADLPLCRRALSAVMLENLLLKHLQLR